MSLLPVDPMFRRMREEIIVVADVYCCGAGFCRNETADTSKQVIFVSFKKVHKATRKKKDSLWSKAKFGVHYIILLEDELLHGTGASRERSK